MKEIYRRPFEIEEWDFEALPRESKELLEAAHAAAQDAYAPYSHFQVGCALRLDSGVIVKGSNQENMAYPSGLCAERVAFFAAGAQHPHAQIIAAAIVTPRPMEVLHFSPCGGCRQVMIESENRQNEAIEVILQTAQGPVLRSKNAAQFLPLSFRLPQ